MVCKDSSTRHGIYRHRGIISMLDNCAVSTTYKLLLLSVMYSLDIGGTILFVLLSSIFFFNLVLYSPKARNEGTHHTCYM